MALQNTQLPSSRGPLVSANATVFPRVAADTQFSQIERLAPVHFAMRADEVAAKIRNTLLYSGIPDLVVPTKASNGGVGVSIVHPTDTLGDNTGHYVNVEALKYIGLRIEVQAEQAGNPGTLDFTIEYTTDYQVSGGTSAAGAPTFRTDTFTVAMSAVQNSSFYWHPSAQLANGLFVFQPFIIAPKSGGTGALVGAGQFADTKVTIKWNSVAASTLVTAYPIQLTDSLEYQRYLANFNIQRLARSVPASMRRTR